MLKLTSPVSDLQMIGPSYIARLAKLNITSIRDLLLHLPQRYENYAVISKIADLQAGETVTVMGTIKEFENIYTKTGKKIQKAVLTDETGSITSIWFNQMYLKKIMLAGTTYTLAGKVSFYQNKLSFISPQFEEVKEDKKLLHTGRIVPIYPETEGLSSKWLRVRIATVLNKINITIPEFLPGSSINKYQLLGEKEAIYKAHFPQTEDDPVNARRRLAFDELLFVQLASQIKKSRWQRIKSDKIIKSADFREEMNAFINKLPFKLTGAQQNALGEILHDLEGETAMNRLLQGDVGSGKTIVSIIAAYLTRLNGYKSLIMAPTEILAKQHFRSFEQFLHSYGLKTALVTKNEKPGSDLDKYDILVGTHALLHQTGKIENLALVIIDEQQRFGVEQRAKLRQKGDNPHVLTMTATPIPRTIALTLYADLNLSTIDQLPKGRQTVKTWVVPPNKREAAYRWISKQISEGKNGKDQAFIICPLIEESETLTSLKSVKKEFERLKSDIFPRLKLGLLHGKLETGEKDRIIRLFRQGVFDILVATPVVEVGLDIPNAVIMMVEGAERFGLSQLHQLRGRVGRSDKQSFCLLFSENESAESNHRLKILEKENIGIRIAEEDLKIRGPGQFFGTKQHGELGLRIATLADLDLIKLAGRLATELLSEDNSLKRFPLLRERLEKYTIQLVAPD